MPIMPNGFSGLLFAAKYNLGSSDFWAVGDNLICPSLPKLKTSDLLDCVDLTSPIINAVQIHLDATVQARGYDNMLTCVSYLLSGSQAWTEEAAAAAVWRDAVWEAVFAIINAGAPYPTADDVISQLPPIVWPS